ncbi:hypothetical protein DKP79_28850, partial [Klebsiella pneumoniae]|uniref:hypothetical protein n=1 Tax=Klebsiella pneumoniae TaxID=573 RepID=UPI000D9407BB
SGSESEAGDAAAEPEETPAESGDSVSEGEDEDDDLEDDDEPVVMEEDDVEIPALSRDELADLEADLSRNKAILERLGPVNVL